MSDLMKSLPSNRREARAWVKRYWAERIAATDIGVVARLGNPYLEELFVAESELLAKRIMPPPAAGDSVRSKIERYVRRSGARGCTERELRHGVYPFRKMSSVARQGVLTAMVASGAFQYLRIEQERQGAARNAIVAVEHIDD